MKRDHAIAVLKPLITSSRVTSEEAEAIRTGIEALKHLPDFQKIGRKGGLATKATHDPEYFRRIGKLGGRPAKKKEKEGLAHGIDK